MFTLLGLAGRDPPSEGSYSSVSRVLLQLDSHACQVLRAAVPFGIHAAMGFKSWFLPSIRKCRHPIE